MVLCILHDVHEDIAVLQKVCNVLPRWVVDGRLGCRLNDQHMDEMFVEIVLPTAAVPAVQLPIKELGNYLGTFDA